MHQMFVGSMQPYQKRLLNTKPTELIKELRQQPLYPKCPAYVTYERSPQALDQDDLDAFNVVFLGPTGCGKSHLINHYFNTTVSHSAGSAESVTQDIQFFLGNALLARAPTPEMNAWHLETRKVNLIDTIGLCDSTLPADVLQGLIKQKLRGNMANIDRVVIVCSGRIELAQQEAIKQFKKWLLFDKYAENFTFIYNKADMLEEDEREEALFQMCTMLETGNEVLTCDRRLFPSAVLQGGTDSHPRNMKKEMKLRNAIGFKPRATYEEIQDDLEQLLDSTLIPINQSGRYKRIPLEDSFCTIL